MMSKSRIAPWTQMSDQTQWNDLIAIPSTVPKALMLERRDTKLQMDGKSLTYGCISKSNLYLRIWWCKFLTAQERTILWAQFSYSDRFLTVLFSMDPTLEILIVGFWILNWLSEYVYSLSNDELNKRIGERINHSTASCSVRSMISLRVMFCIDILHLYCRNVLQISDASI